MGKRWSRQKGSFWKHLHQIHTCRCGKVIRGNGFYRHAKSCKAYQDWYWRQRETIKQPKKKSSQKLAECQSLLEAKIAEMEQQRVTVEEVNQLRRKWDEEKAQYDDTVTPL